MGFLNYVESPFRSKSSEDSVCAAAQQSSQKEKEKEKVIFDIRTVQSLVETFSDKVRDRRQRCDSTGPVIQCDSPQDKRRQLKYKQRRR